MIIMYYINLPCKVKSIKFVKKNDILFEITFRRKYGRFKTEKTIY